MDVPQLEEGALYNGLIMGTDETGVGIEVDGERYRHRSITSYDVCDVFFLHLVIW
jgi:hypothetical protein